MSYQGFLWKSASMEKEIPADGFVIPMSRQELLNSPALRTSLGPGQPARPAVGSGGSVGWKSPYGLTSMLLSAMGAAPRPGIQPWKAYSGHRPMTATPGFQPRHSPEYPYAHRVNPMIEQYRYLGR